MMAALDSTILTNAPRFPPVPQHTHSRSRSRSPVRKAQFAARELDPLLKNLSPDSTLKALQATATIPGGGSGQDALARSIAEASPAEREIGIRAAVAAQKLKQWHRELLDWPWPARRDRGWGAGLLPPQKSSVKPAVGEDVPHLGFLQAHKVQEYRDRIEDIRDGVEALELEKIKDHVFTAHVPKRSVSAPLSLESTPDTKITGYGRMRDFTALITATVIQALPELANLTMLLDAWDVRLSVLRQIPGIIQAFKSTRAGVQTAFAIVRNGQTGPLVTMEEYETTKNILGGKVAFLGSTIDKFLDMLEGQEDSLPKMWIDTLENIENEYATWVVEAEHIAIRNDILAKALVNRSQSENSTVVEPNQGDLSASIHDPASDLEHKRPSTETLGHTRGMTESQSGLPRNESTAQSAVGRDSVSPPEVMQKPSLTILPPDQRSSQRHNRGVSEISMANSAYSAISDLSTAEIVDAKSHHIVTSPKVSVVDNPFRASRDELSLLGTPASEWSMNHEARPPFLQRASTASIEMVSRNSVKKVMLVRSRSHDLLKQSIPSGTRPARYSQVPEEPNSVDITPDHHTTRSVPEKNYLAVEDHSVLETSSAGVSPSPSLRVQPLQLRSRRSLPYDLESPALPRRSSKRQSLTFPNGTNIDMPFPPARTSDMAPSPSHELVESRRERLTNSGGNLQARIKDIVEAMPNDIRFADNVGHGENIQPVNTMPSAVVPALTISPAGSDRAHKFAAPGDIVVYNLAKSGQSRDTTPAKLFVRAVGEHGERVMVRVGGGWADLAEYLREYSLHHGYRGLAIGELEVADFPRPQSTQRSMPIPSTSPVSDVSLVGNGDATMNKRMSSPETFGPGDLPSLTMNKLRKSNRSSATEISDPAFNQTWTPPPVPPIPHTYNMQFPTTVTTTINGITKSRIINPVDIGMFNAQRTVSAPSAMTSYTSQRPQSAIVSTLSRPNGNINGSYTPLGAAGPKSNGRRTATPNSKSPAMRNSWVDGTMGRTRAFTEGTTVVHGPTTTTTTTVISRSIPGGRSVSALANLAPSKTSGSASPANLEAKVSSVPQPTSDSRGDSVAKVNPDSRRNSTPKLISDSRTNSNSKFNSISRTNSDSKVASDPQASAPTARQKNRMSFGDVSAIRRVFLRKKSDNSQ